MSYHLNHGVAPMKHVVTPTQDPLPQFGHIAEPFPIVVRQQYSQCSITGKYVSALPQCTGNHCKASIHRTLGKRDEIMALEAVRPVEF